MQFRLLIIHSQSQHWSGCFVDAPLISSLPERVVVIVVVVVIIAGGAAAATIGTSSASGLAILPVLSSDIAEAGA